MALSDEDQIKLALERFDGLRKEGKLTEFKMLTGKYKASQTVLVKAWPQPFKKNLVTLVKVTTPVRKIERVQPLQENLKRKFGRLQVAVVIDTSCALQQSLTSASDNVHRLLGNGMGEVIGTGGFFRDKDRIGLGSGRAVHSTVSWLAENGVTFAEREIVLLSLAGALFPRYQTQQVNVRLDADFHMQLLSGCFLHPADPWPVHYPLVWGNAQELAKARKKCALDPRIFSRYRPTHAIVGVGVFTTGHRLYEVAAGHSSNPLFDPIRPWLEQLRKVVDRLTSDTYCPVGDIANHLIYFPPPENVKVSARAEDEIKLLVRKISNTLLTVTEEQLQSVPALILVAGTSQKAWAIRQLLNNEKYKVRFLCTDQETAQFLIQST